MMFALTFITPNPRLPSPLFVAKSTSELAFSRRTRAYSTCNSCPWRPNLRFNNGFKLKSATVPENLEGGDSKSGSLVKGLKLGGMFGVWYLLNIYYNIFNKQVPFFFCVSLNSHPSKLRQWPTNLVLIFIESMKLVHPGTKGLSISSDCNSISIRVWNVDDCYNVAP